MNNAVGVAPPPDRDILASESRNPARDIIEYFDDDREVEDHDSPQLLSHTSVKHRSAGPSLDSWGSRVRVAFNSINGPTDLPSFPLYSDEAGGSRSAAIDVDDQRHPARQAILDMLTAVEPESDATSDCVARVLEIIPDVEPEHLTALVIKSIPTHGPQVLQHVLHVLFEDSNYPKINNKGKGKRKRADDESDHSQAEGSPKRPKLDYGYGDMSRMFTKGPGYTELALV
jgi:hypothetical protein